MSHSNMTFKPKDAVICIKVEHPYHAREPKLGNVYIVKSLSEADLDGTKKPIIHTYEDTNYVASHFVLTNLSKIEKLIYNID